MATPRLSPSMFQALDNLDRGKMIGEHVSGRSQSGGFTATVLALRQRGWVISDDARHTYVLTDEGRAALEADKKRPPPRRRPR